MIQEKTMYEETSLKRNMTLTTERGDRKHASIESFIQFRPFLILVLFAEKTRINSSRSVTGTSAIRTTHQVREQKMEVRELKVFINFFLKNMSNTRPLMIY